VYVESASDYFILIEDTQHPDEVYGFAPNLGQGTFKVTKPPPNLWWLFGVFLSIIASILSNLGVNLQKLSMMKESSNRAANEKRSYVFQPMWQIGLLTLIIGSVGDFAALGFAPQSLMTPVGGFTLVCNAVFAHYFLSEHLTRKDKIGTMNIILGIIVLATFGAKENGSFTVDELLKMYATPAFIMYAIFLSISVAVLYYTYLMAKLRMKKYGKMHPKYAPFKKLHPLCCSALSGCLGAQSVLCAKSVAEMFKESVAGNMQFDRPEAWVIVFAMVFFIFSQIHWLARGLETFDAVYIVPVFQCFFISVAVIGGAVYFREFDDMEPLNRLMFMVGLLITLSGVYLLSQRDMSKLKPRQRFRARAFVLIFIIRTRAAVQASKEEREALKHSSGSQADLGSAPDDALPGVVLPMSLPPTSPDASGTKKRSPRASLTPSSRAKAVASTRGVLKDLPPSAAAPSHPGIILGSHLDEHKKRVEKKIKKEIKKGLEAGKVEVGKVKDAVKKGVGKVKVAPVVFKETSPFVVDGEDGDEEDIVGNAIAHPNKSPGDLV